MDCRMNPRRSPGSAHSAHRAERLQDQCLAEMMVLGILKDTGHKCKGSADEENKAGITVCQVRLLPSWLMGHLYPQIPPGTPSRQTLYGLIGVVECLAHLMARGFLQFQLLTLS